jgi:hypothetical protein
MVFFCLSEEFDDDSPLTLWAFRLAEMAAFIDCGGDYRWRGLASVADG